MQNGPTSDQHLDYFRKNTNTRIPYCMQITAPKEGRDESIQAIQPHKNFRFLMEDVTTGTKLVKGQRFAVDDQGYHFAPENCYVVVPSKQVGPNDRDAGFLCRLNEIPLEGINQHV